MLLPGNRSLRRRINPAGSQKDNFMTETLKRSAAGAQSIAQNVDELQVDPEQGLSSEEARQRRERFGPNRLRKAKQRSAWEIFTEQFKSLIIGLLAVAAIAAFAFGQIVEGVAIVLAILVNTAIGFFTELRAVRAMEALQELGNVEATVRRDGQVLTLPAEEIVPGDVVILDSGDVITADLRLIEASKLQIDESALTGESVPVSKQTEPVEGEVPLAEQRNMVFKGTAVTRGSGAGVVVATGMDTELGRISELVEEAETEATPLEKRLDALGQRLIWLTLAVAVLVAISGIVVGKDIFLMVRIAIALAVAAVPEGLPIVATVALARGTWRMAQRNALVNQLSAVETLGATSVICTDKTGTLTENQMTVTRLELTSGRFAVTGEALESSGTFYRHNQEAQDDQEIDPEEDAILRAALEVGVLCNNASFQPARPGDGASEPQAVGDPMEVALLVAGARGGLRRADLLEGLPEAREVAFDPDVKMMATYHEIEDGYRVAVKGAPGPVLDACAHLRGADGDQDLTDEERERWLTRNEELAAQGLRVLALADKTVGATDAEPYQELAFLGLVGLLDPPREEVKPAIQRCQDAGVRVIMVTGDQAVTARSVGTAVGLVAEENAEATQGNDLKSPEDLSADEQQRLIGTPIFARVSPEQKLNLIALHQEHNAIVAMTGDGVNDAPALEKADIGVAMGQRGTQVARDAADMVLQDDAFASIVAAVEQGRAIFNNIRKFTVYLLSGNMGEIIAIAVASLANAPLPLLPLQILYINIVNDVFPALALGLGEGDQKLMERPPRDPEEAILTRTHWLAIVGYGLLIAATLGGAFALALLWLGMEQQRAVTISFISLGLMRLWHVFNMRNNSSGIFRNEITRNRYVWGALGLCTLLLLAAVYLPVLSTALGTVDPGLSGWLLIIGMSLVPLIVGQVLKIAGVIK
jgi:Ca2+-transporting ATPase